jgi:hypothetical protein
MTFYVRKKKFKPLFSNHGANHAYKKFLLNLTHHVIYATIPSPPQSNFACCLLDKKHQTIASNLMSCHKPCIQATLKALENFTIQCILGNV